ncbi:hypothetical protein EV182_004957, partial [Spiromyces aspiralis]
MPAPPRPVADTAAAADVGPSGLPSSLNRKGTRASADALLSDASTPLESRVVLGEGMQHPFSRHDTLSTVKGPTTPDGLEASPEKTASAPPDADEGKSGAYESHGEARVKVGLARRLVIAAGLFLITFLAAMDQTIVAVVLSTIAKEFDAMSSAVWIGTAYYITMAAFQPL